MSFEEEYIDVLQNIEFAVVGVARDDASVLDLDVIDAYEALRRNYEGEVSGRGPSRLRLGAQAMKVYEAAREMCEVRLGRSELDGMPSEGSAPVSVQEIVDCLKRLEKSARRWNKQGGRRGYIEFVSPYIR